MTRAGRLLLVPNTLDLGAGDGAPAIADVLAHGVLAQAAQLTHWVAESAKTTRAFLARVAQVCPLALPLQQITITELPRPAKGGGTRPAHDLTALLAPGAHDIGLLSEAGLPGVADPGAELVAAAHAAGLTVQALAGPSALTLALAASGLHGQSFAFAGYLPVDAAARAARVRELEQRSRHERQTQLAIETPYRNAALFAALVQALQPTTRLAVSAGLTLAHGFSRMHTVGEWRALPSPFDARTERLPAVFCWLA
jgi:16S rRNA (cytidine1402-2'-O)-methyltransferase